MNAKSFSDAMNEIDDKYIDEALFYHGKTSCARRSRRVPVALGAVILALLLMGCVVAAASMFGTRLITFFTSGNESGFDLGGSIEKMPTDDLTGNIPEVEDAIRQRFEGYKPYDSWYPGHWQTVFSTRDAACEYIGFDKLKRIDWAFDEQMTALSVFGNEQGQMLFVDLETFYAIDDMKVEFSSRIYTENYDGEITIETRTTESVTFEESFYITNNNHQCHIISSSALESGYLCMDGYLVDSGILYQLHIAYLRKDSRQAAALMRQWADLF